MALVVKIREAAQNRGIKTAYQLKKRAQIAPKTANRLFQNDAKQLSLETLEKICETLDCHVCELLERVKSPAIQR